MEDTDSKDEEGLGASHLLPPEGEHGPFNSLPLPDPRLLRAGTGGRGILYLVEVLGHNAEPCSVTHLANTADMGTW
jgi:hypothetical protein